MSGQKKNSNKKRKKKPSVKDERKFMEERGFEYVGELKDFKMPGFMDCTWRRVACEKFECKICNKIQGDRMRHLAKGEDPDDIKNVFEDVGKSLQEVLVMIKKDAKNLGINIENIDEGTLCEPPEPEEFPLYKKLKKWQKNVSKLVQDAENQVSALILTEAAADLIWYKNTILVKTYRQLSTRWALNRGEEYGEFDFKYTKYVLGGCLKILKKSLKELSTSTEKREFKILLKEFIKIEKEIIAI